VVSGGVLEEKEAERVLPGLGTVTKSKKSPRQGPKGIRMITQGRPGDQMREPENSCWSRGE